MFISNIQYWFLGALLLLTAMSCFGQSKHFETVVPFPGEESVSKIVAALGEDAYYWVGSISKQQFLTVGKLNGYGDTLWVRDLFLSSFTYGFDVKVIDTNKVLVVGAYDPETPFSPIYATMFNNQGDTLWSRFYYVPNSDLLATGLTILQPKDDSLLIHGMSSFLLGDCSIVFIKTDRQGNASWIKALNEGGWVDQKAILAKDGSIVTNNNRCLTVSEKSYRYQKIDAQADTVLWSYPNPTLAGYRYSIGYGLDTSKTDNGFIFTGAIEDSIQPSLADLLLFKIDENGSLEWTKVYGQMDTDEQGVAVKSHPNGGYVVLGNTSYRGAGMKDIWLLRLSETGDTIWTKTFGGAQDDFAKSIQVMKDGGYLIGGETLSFGASGTDFYFIRTDSLGLITDTLTTIPPAQFVKSEFGIFPNPADRTCWLRLPSHPNDQSISVEIYNLQGQRLCTTIRSIEPFQSTLALDLAVLNAGSCYLIKVQMGNRIFSDKIWMY